MLYSTVVYSVLLADSFRSTNALLAGNFDAGRDRDLGAHLNLLLHALILGHILTLLFLDSMTEIFRLEQISIGANIQLN